MFGKLGSQSLRTLFGGRPSRKPEAFQRTEATARLAAFIATKPRGAISFNELRAVAQGDASLIVFTETVIDLCHSHVLEQFVRVDGDPTFEYADLTVVPDEVNGRPMLLDRVQLYYRLVPQATVFRTAVVTPQNAEACRGALEAIDKNWKILVDSLKQYPLVLEFAEQRFVFRTATEFAAFGSSLRRQLARV